VSRHPIPSDLKPENLVALIDTREQCPLDLAPLAVEMATLQTGDYGIRGLESIVAIERKGDDFWAAIGSDRERFEKEVMRLLAYPHKALVVEQEWHDILHGTVPSRPLLRAACLLVVELLGEAGSWLDDDGRRKLIRAATIALNPPQWRSEVTAASAIGSVLSWQMQGLPVHFAGSHEQAGRDVARMLLLAARRRWRESRSLLAVLETTDEQKTKDCP
jgi:ERCC4-type nuclease